MKNILRRLVFGIQWQYNVVGPDGPIKELGKVLYIVDDFGNLVLSNHTQMNISLFG